MGLSCCSASSAEAHFGCPSLLLRIRRHRRLGAAGPGTAPISPIALEAVKRIDALFVIEREINGLSTEERHRDRQERNRQIVDELRTWLGEQRLALSRSAAVAKPIDSMLTRWEGFTGFLDDSRACLPNNAAERALRGFALGRKAWHFAGSSRGAEPAATMATLIQTAKMNDVDSQAWLTATLARIAATPGQAC